MKSWLQKMMYKPVQHIMKQYLLLLKDLLENFANKLYKYMNSLPKNVYIDKSDDLVNTYSNTYHDTIKMKPADVKSNTKISSSQEINDEGPKLETVGILLGYQNIKTFLQKSMFQIGLKIFCD